MIEINNIPNSEQKTISIQIKLNEQTSLQQILLDVKEIYLAEFGEQHRSSTHKYLMYYLCGAILSEDGISETLSLLDELKKLSMKKVEIISTKKH